MKLNINKTIDLYSICETLSNKEVPFKLGLILARNLNKLEKEKDFYIKQEQQFAMKFFEVDEETHDFIQPQPGQFKIKEGMEQECQQARADLDNFECDIELRKIPMSLLEDMDFTAKQIQALEPILEDEEE